VDVWTAARAQVTGSSGEAVYLKYCASCHDQVSPRIPPREALTKMPAARILRTLDFGLMMSIAYPLRRDEREAVASFLGTGTDVLAPPAGASCRDGTTMMAGGSTSDWTGWSPSAANTRFQPSQSAGLEARDLHRLELKWAFGFGGDVIAFAAPTVFNGTLFVGSAGGVVQALDARSGCLHWRYQANGPVRSAPMVVGDGPRTTLLFSDQNGGVYALDARTGTPRWTRRFEMHEATRLTASIVVDDGVAFIPAATSVRSRAPTARCSGTSTP
jgi:polyvinyl alcohol dehydrogenase (cytochrome)